MSRSLHSITLRPSTSVRARRGVALAFALMAIGLASLIALSYAKSRDSTLKAADELRIAAQARLAAKNGIALATAMLDAGVMPSPREQGVLFASVPIGDAQMDATLYDLETKLPASQFTRAFMLVVAGMSGNMQQVATAVGRVPAPNASSLADVDFSEFAIFSTTTIDIAPDAALARWSNSPFAALHEPLAVATTALDPTQVRIERDADAIDFVIGHARPLPTSADAALVSLADGRLAIPDAMTLPEPPTPPTLPATAALALGTPFTLDGLVESSAHAPGDIRVPARASVTVRGVVTIGADADFKIERGARLTVEGTLALVVGDDFILEASDVEVAPGGSLVIFVGGDVEMDSAFIGPLRQDFDEGRDSSGHAQWDGGAERAVLYSLPKGANRRSTADAQWRLRGNTVAKATLYAPSAVIRLEGTSALYGRAAGHKVELLTGSALFYDPALDDRQGFTASASGVYDTRGRVHAAIRGLASLSPGDLSRLASNLGSRVQSVARNHPFLELAIDTQRNAEQRAVETSIASAFARARHASEPERNGARRGDPEDARDDARGDARGDAASDESEIETRSPTAEALLRRMTTQQGSSVRLLTVQGRSGSGD